MNWPSVFACIASVSAQLRSCYPDADEATQHAWWFLQALTNKTKTALLNQVPFTLSHEQCDQLQQWIERHTKDHEPIAYIFGSVPFGSLTLATKPPILIPRPETEEWCLRLIEQLMPYKNEKLVILDMCTGSGCIALSLAAALPNADLYAVDINPAALALADYNAQLNKISNITFIQSDLFDYIPTIQFDCIVTNPPYLATTEWSTLDQSVTHWEDKRALVAADDGLLLIKKIVQNAASWLNPHSALKKTNVPQLFIEIGYKQGKVVQKICEEHNFDATIMQDSGLRDRVVECRY